MSIRNGKSIFINNRNLYRTYFQDRNVKFIEQYTSPTITYPTASEIQDLLLRKHTWTQGDRFFKLAIEFYGSSRYWWIIPWFNQKPLEADYEYGDLIYIPLPLQEVLALT